MIPKRDQPWFEFSIVQPDGDEFVESLPADTIREATEKMRRIYPMARLTLKRHYKKEMDFDDGPKFQRGPTPRKPAESPPPPRAVEKAAPADFYAVFGVEPGADLATVKKAYRDALKRYHPDRVANLGDEFTELAEKKTREYNDAYVAALKHFRQHSTG